MGTVGRPKKENLESTIKVNVNNETAQIFEKIAKEAGKSKADLLREIIPIVSSKDFEGMLPYTSLEQLEKYSAKCWEILHTEGCIFEVNELSERMPAFVVTWGEPVVYVKYPTFKIQIFNGTNPEKSTDQHELQKLFDGITNVSSVYATKQDYLIVNNEFSRMEYPFVNEITCLDIELKKNIEAKENIISILKQNGYAYSVYPAYCIRGEKIELLENNKYFKLVKSSC